MEMRCKKNKEAFCVGNDAASFTLKPITLNCCKDDENEKP
jgi:hypothetical protein